MYVLFQSLATVVGNANALQIKDFFSYKCKETIGEIV